MISKIIALIKSYKEIVLYLVFGVSSMILNMVTYEVCYDCLGIENVPSTVVAWFVAVLFAFITNKLFVFESKRYGIKAILIEFLSFFGCRIATGCVDVAIMFVSVDLLSLNATLWKFISNVVITVLNYIASKLLIFRKKKEK